jgi:hypothetical protein
MQTTKLVWRGLLLPEGSTILAMLDRKSRADAGVYRVTAGSDPVEIVKPSVSPTSDQTWSEELFTDLDGTILAVQECAPGICRSRFYDVAKGFALVGSDEGGFCQLVGLTTTQYIAFADTACDSGRPAGILTGPIGAGSPTKIGSGDSAVLYKDGGTPRVAIGGETPNGYVLNILSLDGKTTTPVHAGVTGTLLAQPEASGSNYSLLPGWIAIAPGGQLGPDGLGATLINPATGVFVDARSVIP